MARELDRLSVKTGEHVCSLHQDEEERLTALVPFARRALDAGHRFLYLAHDRSAARLRIADLDVRAEQARGALVVLPASEAWLAGGKFDPRAALELLRAQAAKASADGFAGLSIAGEMRWALGGAPGCERLIEYEALLGSALRECGASQLCQYDRGLFPARVQRDVLRTHPVVVLAGQVCPNIYFEQPGLVLGGTDDRARVEWMTAQLQRARASQRECELALAERDRSVQQLEAERLRLSQIVEQMPAGVILADGPTGEVLLENAKAHEILLGADAELLRGDRSPLQRSLVGEAATGQELAFRGPRGEQRTLQCNAAPLRNAAGQVMAGMVAFLDVTEGKRDAAECKRLLEEARASDRRKDEFLAMLGHELRNPLGAISNGLQVLRRKGSADPSTRHERELLERQVRHMSRLLDDLLDVSRITRGLTQLSREPIDLAGVIARAIATTAPLVQLRRLKFELSLPAEPLPVEGDSTRLEQVFANLLSNAAKYTEPGGSIWLSARREEGQAVVRVKDSGVGISEELLPRIFEMFTQGERTLDRSQGGLGVGLTLARRLAELHGGSIEAESAGPGRGSEFVVRLPALVAELAAQPLLRAAKTLEAQAAQGAPSVLLVEDNVDAAAMLYELLGMLGYRVHVAHDGPSGLELAAEVKPDVFLLDIGLPGMDGYEVARQLRRDPLHRGALLVALTGYGQESDRRRSKEAGFDQHLVKPVDVDELDKVIASSRERGASYVVRSGLERRLGV